MALKRLNTQEMVQLSEAWVTDGTDSREALRGVASLAGVLPSLDAAHADLHKTQPAPDNPRLGALSAEESALDLAHDSKVRGVHMLLTALALLGVVPPG